MEPQSERLDSENSESRRKGEAEVFYNLGGLGSGLMIKLLFKRLSSSLIGVSLFLLCVCLDVDTW